ncbi:hypothetical protein MAUB_15820 [Mycolicibacterium aubagnense]|uniref:Uncharacterized protein n=1 Tax=Mycolicibacterium aubagnense TaxID=319707 RepID=A0ABM7IAS9_9MYCO|nr:hypothetical protein MAUB_15820 [Mycolicibacterium aubagnense]
MGGGCDGCRRKCQWQHHRIDRGPRRAAATAVVGLVNDRQQRRHHRDNLALDVELAKLLKDGSAAKQILDGFITSEIRRIAVRGYTEDKRRLRNSVFVFVLAASITVLGIDAASIRTRSDSVSSGLQS